MNVCPQNRGNVGKASEPSTPESARSSTRAFGLVAPGPHLVVGHRGDVHLAAVETAHVAVGSRVERDRDVPLVHVDQPVLVEPVVTPPAVLGHLLLVGRADVEREVAPARPLDARPGARMRSGRRSCQSCAGSTTWSSTLMIFGSSVIA